MLNQCGIKSITDIKHCLYINLASRPDRKQHIEEELRGVGLNPTRFNAIKLKNGRIGCSMSHLKCLQIAKKNNWSHVMICEDDLKILNRQTFVNSMNTFFRMHGDGEGDGDSHGDSHGDNSSANNTWNVLLLAGNNVPPYKKIDDTCIQVSHCQTTTGYIVKMNYYDTLIDNIRTGIENLMKMPDQHIMYAIDKYWIKLQKQHTWYMLAPVVAVQREDYSDIEERKTNYESIMTDLDKPHLLHQQQHIQNKQKGTSAILSKMSSITPAFTSSSTAPMSAVLRK
jgi:GR25 family glycosyltransferase involved in LPS biosynthesis